MKTTPRQFFLGAALACLATLTPAALAQTTSAAPADKEAAAAAAISPSAPAGTSTATTATAAPSASTASTASGANTASTAAVTTAPAPTAASAHDSTTKAEEEAKVPDAAAPSNPTDETAVTRRIRTSRGSANPNISIFNNAFLEKGEWADSVVSVFGNATSEGEVTHTVLAVFGNASATGPVGDAVVSVFGNAHVDAKVGKVVAVFGNVELGPKAEVRGNVVPIFGTIERDPHAIVHGSTSKLNLGQFTLGDAPWLDAYVNQCLYKLRPLAFGAHLGWAWTIAGAFLLFYIFLALLFRGGVDACVNTLETRPGGSILAALLTLLLSPVLFVLLVFTGVGIAVVPFIGVGLLCASFFGKTAMLAWLGRRLTRYFGDGPFAHAAAAVLIGGLIVLGLYTIPVFGFMLYKLIGMLGLGVVVYTLLIRSKRERPVAVAAAPAPAGVSPAAESVIAGAAMVGDTGVARASTATAALPPIAAAALPRAGFWIRVGALFVDTVLVIIVIVLLAALTHWRVNPLAAIPVALAAYGALLWKTKGTTIGGIVCGLKVVRLDNDPVDWPTAIVRALSCFLSMAPLGLGFIWVVLDDEKQSWHDKIAGTTVVHVRGNLSLV